MRNSLQLEVQVGSSSKCLAILGSGTSELNLPSGNSHETPKGTPTPASRAFEFKALSITSIVSNSRVSSTYMLEQCEKERPPNLKMGSLDMNAEAGSRAYHGASLLQISLQTITD